MDDPWGSPWTTTNVDPTPQRTPSPTKSDLEPPPRAFLSHTSSPRLPSSTAPSPWADGDDAFGDWASTNTTAEAAQSTSAWAGWGAADVNTSREHLGSRPRDDSFTNETPIAWPGSIAPSPGPKPANGSIIRQLSPDPWASEFAAEDHNAQPIPSLVIAEPPDSPALIHGTLDGVTIEEPGSIWDNNPDDVEGSTRQDAGDVPALGSVSSDSHEPPAADAPTSPDNEPPAGVSRIAIEPRTQSVRSRSSSVSGDISDHDAGRQDSPITSVDEDSKARSQSTSRKVPGKVQDLVVKFDSLAKAAVDDPPLTRQDDAGRPAKTGQDLENGLEDSVDFGDFEDGGDSTSPTQTSRGSSPDRTPTPQIRRDSLAGDVSTPTSPHAPFVDTKMQESMTKSGGVKFVVDLDKVDSLFSGRGLDDSQLQTTAGAEVQDRPITDSFTEISERKAWYRISRQGSSRMHDGGDDDSYCRVAWPSSSARQETLAIVRRWMEEDSITGRATLGGGPSRRDMFGWDSAAEPVSLEKVFGRPRDKTQPRAAPAHQPLRIAPVTTQETLNSSTQNPSTAAPSVAAFGWSTASAVNGPTKPLSATPVHNVRRADPLPSQEPTRPPSKPLVPSLGVAIPPAAANDDGDEDEDEDEWGDMVSSPQDDTKPAITNGLGSLDGIFSEPPQPSTEPSKPKPQPTPMPLPITTRDPIGPPKNDVGPTNFSGSEATKTSSTSEPWASVDFTFFDQPPKIPVTTAAHVSKNIIPPTTPISISSLPSVSEEIRKAGAPKTTTALPLEKDIAENDDTLVRRVLDGLPDLSYMLR